MVLCFNSLEDLDGFLSKEHEMVNSENSFTIFTRKLDSALLYLTSQEEFNTSENDAQLQMCNFIIESPFFSSSSSLILSYLKERSCYVEPDSELYSCLWLYYGILFSHHSTTKSTLELNPMERKQLFSKLVKEIQEPIDGRLELPALLLLSEILKQSISSSESKIICDLLPFLFKLTECARENNESVSYAVNHLLIIYHHHSLRACPDHFDLDSSSIKQRFRKRFDSLVESSDPFCDSKAAPDFEGVIQCSPVLLYIQNNFYTATHFGGDLIFMINREDDMESSISVLNFLTDLFNHPHTSEYFYTNDLIVLVDIIVRQLCNIDDYLYELRYAFLTVLTSLMNFSQYRASLHKLDEIRNLLNYMSSQPDHSDPASLLLSDQATQLLTTWSV